MHHSSHILKNLPVLLTTAVILALSPSVGRAAFVTTYEFTGGSAAASVSGTDAASVTAGDFINVGAADISSNSEMAFLSMGQTGGDLAAALADDDYFSVTLSAANPGEFLNLSTLTLDYGGSTNGGGATIHLVVQSSLGGFGTGNPTLTVTPSSNTILGGAGEELTPASVDISSSAFDNLNSVTFQFRFFDSSNTGNSYDRMDNVVFSGAVIPEPSSLLLLLLGGVSSLALRRHRLRN